MMAVNRCSKVHYVLRIPIFVINRRIELCLEPKTYVHAMQKIILERIKNKLFLFLKCGSLSFLCIPGLDGVPWVDQLVEGTVLVHALLPEIQSIHYAKEKYLCHHQCLYQYQCLCQYLCISISRSI